MGHREIYSNAPLALTVVELRHTASTPLSEADKAGLKSLLASTFPIYKPAQQVSITVTHAGAAEDRALFPRYMTRDFTESISFRDNAVVVETTRYKRRSALRELLHQAVDARQKVSPVDGIERLGIRYVNEVRVPNLEHPSDWGHWISPPLTSIASLRTEDMAAQTWQGVTVFGTPSVGVVLRHGNFEGYAVEPAGDLRRQTPPPGPFYLLDLDSYWLPEGEVPQLEWASVEERFDAVGLSAYELFQQLITDHYRTEVLKREQ
ncbi:TIGR04255 family protein [Streptomyces sp. PTM05]|uniref:TIGR04255 family protein n=1 Tax=Streptantibioticus parmotrematis TaxID=2873249 RepID=A0ABS7QZF3_9ACTN|nr:TIGR04255 family protein [Streptantibioticus parmotrematis]MBY8887685.1 TIGR04255 family protein [Streptantibioticus parmotrematis]